MNKKKIFLVISSMKAGGAERVFWLLSQGFNKTEYDVSIVLFNSNDAFFSMKIEGVRVIDLKTIKASLSFFKLFRLIKKEKPYAIFGTADHINILISLISFFIKTPYIIARPTSVSTEMVGFGGKKTKFWSIFVGFFYKKFNSIVCQSQEIQTALLRKYNLNPNKTVIIPNPILSIETIKNVSHNDLIKRIIIVARLSFEKGHSRLLDVFKELPSNYVLTIVGGGKLKDAIIEKVKKLNIEKRVHILGQVSGVPDLIAQHDILVLSSFTEGFPNVILEALSVGVPVVTFSVGGASSLIVNDFNGYIVNKNDESGFKAQIIEACNKDWDSIAIKDDVNKRFSLNKIVDDYERLIK